MAGSTELIAQGSMYAVILITILTFYWYLRSRDSEKRDNSKTHGLWEKMFVYGFGIFFIAVVVSAVVESFIFDSLWFNYIANLCGASLITAYYYNSDNFTERKDLPMALVGTAGFHIWLGIVAIIGYGFSKTKRKLS